MPKFMIFALGLVQSYLGIAVSCVLTRGTLTVVLFWNDMKPLGHGALLEEGGHWGGPDSLPVHLGGNMSSLAVCLCAFPAAMGRSSLFKHCNFIVIITAGVGLADNTVQVWRSGQLSGAGSFLSL